MFHFILALVVLSKLFTSSRYSAPKLLFVCLLHVILLLPLRVRHILLDDLHSFYCKNYFVLGGILTRLGVSSVPVGFLDNHRKASYSRTQQCDQVWTQIMQLWLSLKKHPCSRPRYRQWLRVALAYGAALENGTRNSQGRKNRFPAVANCL